MGTVITQLLGGLGNQMFQYAVGRRLALEKKRRLLVDTSILEDHSPGCHEVNRKYALEIFKLQAKRAEKYERWLYNAHGLPLIVRVLRRSLGPVTKKWIYRNLSFEYDKKLFDATPVPQYIQGLWQSYKYLVPIAEQLQKDFEFKDTIPKKTERVKEAILGSNSVCLNVRRGDYLMGSSAKNMAQIEIEYYKAATKKFKATSSSDLKVFVFSDDIKWCKRQFGWLGTNAVIVGHEHAGQHFGIYLQLMSLCKKFILPNSTFAWWAAWLAKAPDKQVIAPKRWFTDTNINTQDLCPPNWQRI